MRQRFKHNPLEVSFLDVDGKLIAKRIPDSWIVGQVIFAAAGVGHSLHQTKDGEFIHVITVMDDGYTFDDNAQGWYHASFLSREHAVKLRDSWVLLNGQEGTAGIR